MSQPLPQFFEETDLDNARLLITQHATTIRFATDTQSWFLWENNKWHDDGKEGYAVSQLWSGIAYQMPKRIIDPKKNDGSTIPFQHRKYSLSAQGIRNTINVAKQFEDIQCQRSDFDSKPYELNTPDGPVDLHTAQLLSPLPENLHTRETRVTPKEMPTPMWDKFLQETFQGRQDEIDYMQALLGVSAIGEVIEQIFPFIYGPSGTGKSTFFEVVSQLLGDYATTSDASLVTKGQDRHPEELARLHGKRMVIMSEIKQSDSYNEQRLKLLTGNDTINARFMNQNSFSFQPTHTLFVFGNFQPSITETGDAVFRRLKLVDFDHVPRERVVDLKKQLITKEGPGILNWVLMGTQRYLEDKSVLKTPARIQSRTDEYQDEEDIIGTFVKEACLVADNAQIGTTELYTAYTDWCKANGVRGVLGRNKFMRALTQSQGKYGNILGNQRLSASKRGLKGITVLPVVYKSGENLDGKVQFDE